MINAPHWAHEKRRIWASPYAPAPVPELRYVPGALVKPGCDANELGVGRTTIMV
jgi:hypothetical protein